MPILLLLVFVIITVLNLTPFLLNCIVGLVGAKDENNDSFIVFHNIWPSAGDDWSLSVSSCIWSDLEQ